MIAKLYIILYLSLFVGMFILFFANFPIAWIYFAFMMLTTLGIQFILNRPSLFTAGLLLTSLLVLAIGIYGMYQSLRPTGWPTTWGAITRAWTSCDESSFGPCIEYTYAVDGKTYNASSVDTHEFEYQSWLTIPDKFERGHEVQVRYDPANPSISRLSAEISARDWITVIIGGIMALLSALGLVYLARGSSVECRHSPACHR